MIDKFQGNVNKLIEEDESESHSNIDGSNEINNEQYDKRLKILERKNEILMGKSPNLA